MREELINPDKSRLLADREPVPKKTVIERGKRLINPITGPILALNEEEPVFSSRNLCIYHYISPVQHTSLLGDSSYRSMQYTGGTGFNKQDAKLTAIGEAIERYCMKLYDLDDFKHDKFTEMRENAVNPLAMNKLSERQLKEREVTTEEIKNKRYYWTISTSLLSGEKKMVPAQFIYLPFRSDFTIKPPSSTGAAAGTDYKSAIFRAISEVIERECFIIGYLNKLNFPEVDIESINDTETKQIINKMESRGLEVKILDISLDHPLKVCLTIIISRNTGKAIRLGMDSSTSLASALKSSLEEAAKGGGWNGDLQKDSEDIRTLEERAKYWSSPEKTQYLDFWLSTSKKEEIKGSNNESTPLNQKLEKLLSFLDSKDYDCYIKDMTSPDIDKHGFKVVKAVLPSLHPLHLVEEYRSLGSERLYEVPVDEGFLEKQKNENKMNSTPHPFI